MTCSTMLVDILRLISSLTDNHGYVVNRWATGFDFLRTSEKGIRSNSADERKQRIDDAITQSLCI